MIYNHTDSHLHIAQWKYNSAHCTLNTVYISAPVSVSTICESVCTISTRKSGDSEEKARKFSYTHAPKTPVGCFLHLLICVKSSLLTHFMLDHLFAQYHIHCVRSNSLTWHSLSTIVRISLDYLVQNQCAFLFKLSQIVNFSEK